MLILLRIFGDFLENIFGQIVFFRFNFKAKTVARPVEVNPTTMVNVLPQEKWSFQF
jgi:hypothetical protein